MLWCQGFVSFTSPANAIRPAVSLWALSSLTTLRSLYPAAAAAPAVAAPSFIWQTRESYCQQAEWDWTTTNLITSNYTCEVFTSFTPSVSATISVPFSFSFSFSVSVLLGGGVHSMFTSVFLPLLVSSSKLFTDSTRVWGRLRTSDTILPANKQK